MGRDLIPFYIRDHNVVRRIYQLSEDVSTLFDKYFPIPPASIFDQEKHLPKSVRKKEKSQRLPISERMNDNLGSVIMLQRRYRRKLRQKKKEKT